MSHTVSLFHSLAVGRLIQKAVNALKSASEAALLPSKRRRFGSARSRLQISFHHNSLITICCIFSLNFPSTIQLSKARQAHYHAAMEALAGASSIIAIVGLAGQVVQGCMYLNSILGGMKDAPDDLALLIRELEIIQQVASALSEENFRSDAVPIGCDPTPALEFCIEAIGKVQKLVANYGGPSGALDHMNLRQRFQMGMSQDKIRKHLGRLERAKTHLLASNNARLL